MKKTLLLLLAASIITPAYQCMAAQVSIERYEKPMGRLAKAAVLVGLSAATVAAYKISSWYNQEETLGNFNRLFPVEEHSLSGSAAALPSTDVVYADYSRFADISDIWNKENRDVVVSDLVANGKSLSAVQTAIKEELKKYNQVTEEFRPFLVWDKKKKKGREADWSKNDLQKYYKQIEDGSVEKDADVTLGKFQFSTAYAWNACSYVWNKAKQLKTWVMKKPLIDQETRKRFVEEVLKKKHRLDTLLAVVDERIGAGQETVTEDAKLAKKLHAQSVAQRAPVIAPPAQARPARCVVEPSAIEPSAEIEELETRARALQEAIDRDTRSLGEIQGIHKANAQTQINENGTKLAKVQQRLKELSA